MSVTVNGTNGLTFNDGSVQNTAPSGFGFKNRIINGACMIDQRNAGASVTVNSGSQAFPVDRFFGTGQSSDGVYTLQQSSVAPTGFVNSIIATVTTADASIGATQNYLLRQRIEGFNIADFMWGTASAQTVTLSFWVRSSLTGTFGGTLHNGNGDRFYPYSYTINSANTWEYKTITIVGDTTGTWEKTNGIGLNLIWSLGTGSTLLGTTSAWTATTFTGFTGQTNLIATSGATWQVTGVQLEKGSTATSFDYRPYGTELALCQRYYYKLFPAAANRILAMGQINNSTEAEFYAPFVVTMRTRPTALETNGTASDYKIYSADANTAATTVIYLAGTTDYSAVVRFTVASGLTTGRAASAQTNTGATTAFLAWSAEL
jgi:hypothetical protein